MIGVSCLASVESGGAKGTLAASWSGTAKAFASFANPLVFPEAAWCARSTRSVVFGDEVALTWADGEETNAFKALFTCNP